MDHFYIVERKAKQGSNIPVGLSHDGKPGYGRNWQEAVWFVRREDALKFLAQAANAHLPVYGDMTDDFEVVPHGKAKRDD